jgi:His-Xaa-Ser system radical SAM maturase HxsC
MDYVTDLKTAATPLHGRLSHPWEAEPFVAKVTRELGQSRCSKYCLITADAAGGGDKVQFVSESDGSIQDHRLPNELSHVGEGDILRVNPRRGELWVMYRRQSRFNSMLLTERCNSWCVMCSQPPKTAKDDYLIDAWSAAIPLMSPDTAELGITGGEPTLLGSRFLELVSLCARELPKTGLHVLTNGRKFNYLGLARQLATIQHPDLMLGIPLYSDLAWQHDLVVQADNAFDQTIRGILNLARCRVRIEVRVVIHRHTADRLPQLCAYIARNLPFVEHIALMGLEPIGFGKTNLDSLWIDPLDYQPQLKAAVECLQNYGLRASIYNHQLCVLPMSLWAFARQSISDWKNIYMPACTDCAARNECAGFFHSAANAHSRGIRPVSHEEFTACPIRLEKTTC